MIFNDIYANYLLICVFIYFLTSYGPAKHSLSADANVIQFILIKTLFTMKKLQ